MQEGIPKVIFFIETGKLEGGVWAGRDIRISIGRTKRERKVWGRKRGNSMKIVSWELGVSTDTSLQVRGHRMGKRDGKAFWETPNWKK